MSFLFGKTKVPEVKIPTAPVAPAAPKVEKVVEETKAKLKQGRKKRSTLLTGPRGILEPAEVMKKKLGA